MPLEQWSHWNKDAAAQDQIIEEKWNIWSYSNGQSLGILNIIDSLTNEAG